MVTRELSTEGYHHLNNSYHLRCIKGSKYNYLLWGLDHFPDDLPAVVRRTHWFGKTDMELEDVISRILSLSESEYYRNMLRVSKDSWDLSKLSIKMQLIMVGWWGESIKTIDRPTAEIQLAAAKNGGLSNISNPSHEIQLAAVKNDGFELNNIEYPTLAMQTAAVGNDGGALKNIKAPTHEMQLAAVKNGGSAIKFIKNPTLKMMLAAVRRDPQSLQYIKRAPYEVQLTAVKLDGRAIRFVKNKSEELQVEAIKQNPYNIKLFRKSSTYEAQKLAVQMNAQVIYLIDNPSEELQLIACRCGEILPDATDSCIVEYFKIGKSSSRIMYKNPFSCNPHIIHSGFSKSIEHLYEEILQYVPNQIRFIKTPSEAMKIAAVTAKGKVIQYISNPSKVVKLAAVMQDGHAIQYIVDPDQDIIAAALMNNPNAKRHLKR